jgi:hypothetical protein
VSNRPHRRRRPQWRPQHLDITIPDVPAAWAHVGNPNTHEDEALVLAALLMCTEGGQMARAELRDRWGIEVGVPELVEIMRGAVAAGIDIREMAEGIGRLTRDEYEALMSEIDDAGDR